MKLRSAKVLDTRPDFNLPCCLPELVFEFDNNWSLATKLPRDPLELAAALHQVAALIVHEVNWKRDEPT